MQRDPPLQAHLCAKSPTCSSAFGVGGLGTGSDLAKETVCACHSELKCFKFQEVDVTDLPLGQGSGPQIS